MEWLTDPTVWLGLTTLVLLEIVLGIDNLIFIAILASKLPPDRQNSARQLGLGLALLLRLALLAGVFWLTTLTTPLFVAFGHRFSGRDLILLAGGLFLLLKATVEIHERLENQAIDHSGEVAPTSFAAAVAQIVLLDAIFSVDSILTAVGMTDMLAVMMAAVIVAMAIMFVASRPLMEFVSAHPPLVILCLGFLLMVGFSLVAEGVGFHIPKGYLYAAIGFSVVIEMFNQIGAHNRKRWSARIPRRQRVAQTVLRLLGGVPANAKDVGDPNVDLLIGDDSEEEVFAPSEKEMIRGVLALADRPVSSIMTPRPAVLWIDLDDTQENILSDIRNSPHAQLLVSRGSIDEIVGIVRKQDLLDLNIENKALDVRAVTRAPVVVYEATSILKTLELFKLTPVHMAVVVDEYGSPVGVVTQTDLLEAIAGDLPDPQGQQHPDCVRRQDGSLIIDASISIYDAVELLGLKDLPPGDYQTLAGFVLLQAGKIPQANDHFNFGGWRFEILEMEGPRITKLLATPEDHRNRT